MIVKAIGFGMLAAIVAGFPAQAEVFKDKTGISACTPSLNEEILKRPDGSSVRRVIGNCISASDAAYPFDHQKQVCYSTTELGADGKMVFVHGYCEVTSTKGDRAAYTITYDPTNHGKWVYFSGQGAYAGIKGSGTYKMKTGFQGGGGVYDWVGTWETGTGTAQK